MKIVLLRFGNVLSALILIFGERRMSIVTKGLGGCSLVTQGYGFLEWIKKVIKKVVSRLIPWKRKRFKLKIKVYGSPVHPFEETLKVRGRKDFSPILFILLDDDEELESLDLSREKELLDKLLGRTEVEVD